MKWNELNDINQLAIIDRESTSQKILILKHSTRCSISGAALARLERKWKDENNETLKPYYLDLLANRDISNAIAERYNVVHESPQALVISNGKCIFSQTHMEINADDLVRASQE
ncbi:MAG: bacillithiol system redox-active protein YtxJ [Bacteroidia bacterium]|nr:bacillithiol system redox-active protein YtxJ [Bacteroidia bacterium]